MKSRRNVLEGIRSNFLSPYSPVITLLIGLFLTLLATGNDLPWYIDIFVKNKTVLLVIIIAWLIIAIMHTIYESDLNNKKEEIIKLNEAIKEKNNQLNQSSGIILNKYGEFARFNKINRFEEILKSFVENNVGVDAAQIYKYSSKINGKTMKIRLNYEQGFAYEDVDINGLLQAYYTIDVEYYEKINNIVELWNNLIKNDNISVLEYEALEEKLFKSAEDLLTYLIGELKAISDTSDIQEYHYTYYRILILLINIIAEEKTFSGVLDNEVIEQYLIQGKRTGILGAVLLNDNYIFKHVGKSSKNGRIYMSFPIKLYDENYVVLISISSSLLNDIRIWNRLLINFKNDFILRVNNTNLN
ncbi:hypothetical protein [uncultured Clostridium sp.]|uniref:hypothetical protein n=1 Tax=uncultured Clostridium sp. TaxID=59620 RepID=UPI0025DD86C5|nr:hypothetical protein [uncultured Clostridium sp.]